MTEPDAKPVPAPHAIAADAEGIDRAARCLAAGELLAFPTETVYGLGADADDPAAVRKIFALKGRPANHPVIVHLPPGGDPLYWCAELPASARALIDAFWPGPLTLILRRHARIDAGVSGGQDTIGLRCPSHPVAQALLRAFSSLRGGYGGVAGPSANRFGRVSPTTAQHVIDEFGAALPVLEGGPCEVGIESTIVDVSRGFAALLRPGGISATRIEEIVGALRGVAGAPGSDDVPAPPRVSGALRAHYAPRTPLYLTDADGMRRALVERDAAVRLVLVAEPRTLESLWAAAQAANAAAPAPAAPRVVLRPAPLEPVAYARSLYGMLRGLDAEGFDRILVEALPDTLPWRAVNDRLGRAAAAFEDA